MGDAPVTRARVTVGQPAGGPGLTVVTCQLPLADRCNVLPGIELCEPADRAELLVGRTRRGQQRLGIAGPVLRDQPAAELLLGTGPLADRAEGVQRCDARSQIRLGRRWVG